MPDMEKEDVLSNSAFFFKFGLQRKLIFIWNWYDIYRRYVRMYTDTPYTQKLRRKRDLWY